MAMICRHRKELGKVPSPPRKGESKGAFIARAIRVYMNEGYPQKQAVAMAYAKWRKHKGGK